MLRLALIIAFVGTDLSFFLSERRGRRGPRHGRAVRTAALLSLNIVLLLGLFRFRYVTAAALSLCYLSVSLALLLLPVPPNKFMRLNALSAASLAAVPAALFIPAVCPYVLMVLLILSRAILALRRRGMMEFRARTLTFRKTLEQEDRATWEAVWLSFLLLSTLTSGHPAGEMAVFVLSALLYAWLDARWCAASCFFAVPDLDDAVARAQSGKPRSAPGEPFVPDHNLYERCCRYMTERRPFLVESFSLTDLCNAMFTNKVYLSRTINECAGKNFRQWVNSYRVQYAQDLFRRNMSLKVVDLATLSGFHSASTFNQAFKLVMDESPSDWCRRIRYRRLSGRDSPQERAVGN